MFSAWRLARKTCSVHGKYLHVKPVIIFNRVSHSSFFSLDSSRIPGCGVCIAVLLGHLRDVHLLSCCQLQLSRTVCSVKPLSIEQLHVLLLQALHESLLEVGEVFDDCARFGIVRSLINAGGQDAVSGRVLSAA
jgi:hypothetical protein